MGEEKRESTRGSSLTEVSYEHEGVLFQGKVNDLSQGGLFIETLNPLPEGTRLTFRFGLPGGGDAFIIMGEGVVAWQRPFQGMGIRFTWISDEDLEKLKSYLSRS